MVKIVTLSGSIRHQSHNTKLAAMMGRNLTALGAEVTNLDLADYHLPLFNADRETREGEPEAAVALAELFAGADAIFIASPEYNGSVTPLLKNSIDWISRQRRLAPFKRAVFGLGSVTPGRMAGAAGLRHLRDILGALGALVAPAMLGVGNGQDAFDADGELTETGRRRHAGQLAGQLMTISRTRP